MHESVWIIVTYFLPSLLFFSSYNFESLRTVNKKKLLVLVPLSFFHHKSNNYIFTEFFSFCSYHFAPSIPFLSDWKKTSTSIRSIGTAIPFFFLSFPFFHFLTTEDVPFSNQASTL